MVTRELIAQHGPTQILDALARSDFAAFTQVFFFEASGGKDLIWSPYLSLVCAEVTASVAMRQPYLMINIPPRHLKSIIVSVLLPAYYLMFHPERDVMCVSYAQALTRDLADKTRRVMTSPRYRTLCDTRLKARSPWRDLQTTAGGRRRAISLDGGATGFGADLIVFDDPQKPKEMSEVMRRSSNEQFETTFLSRRNDPAQCPMIIVMQRLHEDDFCGHVLKMSRDSWKVVRLPAIAEEDERFSYMSLRGPMVFKRKRGEALNPARLPVEELELLRLDAGEAVWAGQYQQRPAPAGGEIVNTRWFVDYDPADLPKRFHRVLQSWDTANKIGEVNAFSVCVTMGVVGADYWVLSVARGRWLYPQLRDKVLELAREWKPNDIVIEDCASGVQLLQELPELGVRNLVKATPTRDKQMRMSNQTGPIKDGRFHVPREAAWREEFVHEFSVFPNGRFYDQVDATSQALEHLRTLQPGEGLRRFYRDNYIRLTAQQPKPKLVRIDMTSSHLIREGRTIGREVDGYFHLEPPVAEDYLARHAWDLGAVRIPDDAPPKYPPKPA